MMGSATVSKRTSCSPCLRVALGDALMLFMTQGVRLASPIL
jgi:hypothetical protein